jgi:hypothetical protein
LWSGGLDSLAGLPISLSKTKNSFILLSTGGNHINQSIQKDLYLKIDQKFPGRLKHEAIYLESRQRLKHFSSTRGRGFYFLVIGAAVASLYSEKTVDIFENGVGAINLPLPGSIGIDMARSVHPLTLTKVSQFVSAVLEENIKVVNPFISLTKGEMVAMCNEEIITELFEDSRSCDRPQRVKDKGNLQCGRCSSCLLRRASLQYAGLEESKTEYKFASGIDPKLNFYEAMARQVELIENRLASKQNQWSSLLSQFPELYDVELSNSIPNRKVVRLLEKYASEWKSFITKSPTKEKAAGN